MTATTQPTEKAARADVSHVTGISAKKAASLVRGGWEELRVALRIPDDDRGEDEKYTTASGRLFDYLGERVQEAAASGEPFAEVPFRLAAAAVIADVLPPNNWLTPNQFSKELGRWKRGTSAVTNDPDDLVVNGNSLRTHPDGMYDVVFTILSPKEAHPKKADERPAVARFHIERDKRVVDVQKGEPPEHATVGKTPLVRTEVNPALLGVGLHDIGLALDRVEAAAPSPEVRKQVRQMRSGLRTLIQVAGKSVAALVIVAVMGYLFSPRPAQAAVNAYIKKSVERIERWWRLHVGPFFVGVRDGVPDGTSSVYRDVSPTWFQGFGELRPLPPFVQEDDEQSQGFRADEMKNLIRFAGGDPGSVDSTQLRWVGGLRAAVASVNGRAVLRLLAVPNQRNQFSGITYVWSMSLVPVERIQHGEPGVFAVPAEMKVTTHPVIEWVIPDKPDLVILSVKVVMIPDVLLKNREKDIARDCELAELYVRRFQDDVVAFRVPDGQRRQFVINY